MVHRLWLLGALVALALVGTFDYVRTIHPGMVGQVTVVQR
jgi:plastocyanin